MLGHPAVARSGNGQERPDKVIFDRWEAASRNFVPFRIAENDLKTGFKGQMACRSTKVLPCRCLANNCRYALNSQLTFTAASTGTYFANARAFANAGSGGYRLSATQIA
jgi:hypothetical protein